MIPTYFLLHFITLTSALYFYELDYPTFQDLSESLLQHVSILVLGINIDVFINCFGQWNKSIQHAHRGTEIFSLDSIYK